MDIFGEHRKVYDMSLIPTGGGQSLIDPIIVGRTAFAQPGTQFVTDYDHIMPLSFKWTANSGVQGSFLVVGFQREVNTGVNPDWVTPIGFTGTVNNTGNGSGGGIIGDIVKSPHHGLDDWGVVSFLATKGDCINLHGGTPVGNVKPAWETIRYYSDADSKYANFDFEDIVTKVGRVTFDPLPSGDSIVIVDSNGDLSHIVDGTSGQILETDGSGGYRFVDNTASSTDTIQIASRSPQLNLTTGRSYYFGNTSTGWESSIIRNQTTITSISYAFANCGIVCPKALTSLSFMANIRSVNRTDNLTVKVAKGARPDGTTTAITLTELGSDTITVGQLYRFYKMDIDVTRINVRKGDLIFLFWYRDGVSVSAANYYTTWTLQGS